MRINLRTPVGGTPQSVFDRFNETLFRALTPPFATLQLRRFEGCHSGAKVELSMRMFGILSQHWSNEVTASLQNENECMFRDEGRILPFPLRRWTHDHRIVRTAKGCEIRDEIEFSCGNQLLDALMLPMIWLPFRMRKPVYQKFFGKGD